MLIKTLLNKVERFKSFVYGTVCIMLVGGKEALIIDVEEEQEQKGTDQFVPIAERVVLDHELEEVDHLFFVAGLQALASEGLVDIAEYAL